MVLISLSCDGGPQLGEVLPPETVAMSGNTFGCYSWECAIGWRPGVPLDALQWTGQPPTSENCLTRNVSECRGGEALGYKLPSVEGMYRAWRRVELEPASPSATVVAVAIPAPCGVHASRHTIPRSHRALGSRV